VKTDDPKTNGCPPPPADKDADGIPDDVDACPDKAGVKTDDPKTNGCPPPPPDKDKDGIPDDADACPDQPGVANEDPKKNGCPALAVISEGQIKISEQVKFKTGSAEILKDSDELLTAVYQILKDHPDIKVKIEGHTDNKGAAAMNLNLSKKRAASVSAWLQLHGIDKARLTSEGYGQTRPIDSNDTDAGRQNNRRVEFHIQ
jgi:outer membrane protein OmpA-like peptidoglycan-associated protein